MGHCVIKNCDRKIEARGYCRKHYLSFMKYGKADFIDERKESRNKLMTVPETVIKNAEEIDDNTCKVIRCHKPVKCRGMCDMHYARMRRNGIITTKSSMLTNKIKECMVFNCNNKPAHNFLCDEHLETVTKNITPYKPKIIEFCGVTNCSELHLENGLCKSHLKEWMSIVERFNLG